MFSKAQIIPAEQAVNVRIIMPGSKSFTNRALVMAALADGESKILNYSESDDSKILIAALRKIGVKITKTTKEIIVKGTSGKFKEFNGKIDFGMAGTSIRFFASIACLAPGTIILDGSERMRQRPIDELINALRDLGAKITYLGENGYPPIEISDSIIKGGKTSMKGTISSQYFTSLLLIAPVLEKGIEIQVEDEQVSKSYIDMTIASLKSFGARVGNQEYKKYIVRAKESYKATDYCVEGDISGASYFWAIAALTNGIIRVEDVDPCSSQGDVKFPDLLERMGCRVKKNSQERWIEVEGLGELTGTKANMESMPDTAQTLSVVASFAKGKTKITGLSTLEGKETKRLSALQTELAKMGIKSEIGDDYIIVEGGTPLGATIATHNDHRTAMAFAIAGAKISGIEIMDPAVVNKSFPDFWKKLESIGARVKML